MKKLTKMLMMAMALLLLASCGSGNDKSAQKTTPDPDKMMDELLVAGRAGDWQKVLELDEELNKQKMTTEQAFRFSMKSGQNTMLWVMKVVKRAIGGTRTELCMRNRMLLLNKFNQHHPGLKRFIMNRFTCIIASFATHW